MADFCISLLFTVIKFIKTAAQLFSSTMLRYGQVVNQCIDIDCSFSVLWSQLYKSIYDYRNRRGVEDHLLCASY